MQVKILEGVIAAGERYAKDDTPDIPEKDARFLIARGKAVAYTPKKKAKKAPANRQIEDFETR